MFADGLLRDGFERAIERNDDWTLSFIVHLDVSSMRKRLEFVNETTKCLKIRLKIKKFLRKIGNLIKEKKSQIEARWLWTENW